MLKDLMVIKNLRPCHVCGHQAFMRQNASKHFEIYCPKCHSHSIWANKVDCVVDWYNKAEIYEKTHADE